LQHKKISVRRKKLKLLNSENRILAKYSGKKKYLNERSFLRNGRRLMNCEERENLFEKHFKMQKNRSIITKGEKIPL
jgi:hypothetical protein